MTNKIALTASMRSNLLSLKNTQSLLDKTQDRLSTGYKVNSAMDNPSSYFTAQALNSRADDLSGLLDSIGQAISTLQTADQGITTLQSFVEQAKSIANNARDTSNVPSKATTDSVKFNPDTARTDLVSEYVDLTAGPAPKSILGNAALAADDKLVADLNLTAGQTIDFTVGDDAAVSVAVAADDTVESYMAKVVDAVGSDKIKAELVDGSLKFSTVNSADLKIESARDTESHATKTYTFANTDDVSGWAAGVALTTGDGTSTFNVDLSGVAATQAATGVGAHLADDELEAAAAAYAAAINAAAETAGENIVATADGATVTIKDLTLGNDAAAPSMATGPATAAAGPNVGVPIPGTSAAELLGFSSNKVEGSAEAGNSFSVRLGDATKMTGTANLRADKTLEEMGMTDGQSIDIIVGDDIHTYTIGKEIDKTSTMQQFMDDIVYDIGRTKIKAEIVDGTLSISTLDNSSLDIRSTSAVEARDAIKIAKGEFGVADRTLTNVVVTPDGGSATTVDLTGIETAEGVADAINNNADLKAAGVMAKVDVNGNVAIFDKNGDNAAPTITFNADDNGTPYISAGVAGKTDYELKGTSFNELVGFEPAQKVEITQDMTVEKFRQAINNLEGVSADFDTKGHLIISGEQGDDLVMVNDANSNVLKNLFGNDVVSATNGSNERAVYAKQFDDILTQIDELVQDTSYKGINLLNGDSLLVNFNESRTSSLNIKGVTFDSVGLGFTRSANEWISNTDIDNALNQISKATSMLRAQASEFGQNLSTVQIREDFTQNMINNLQSGADKLTLADMNEEAANMLALQTRQQLGVNSLSMASQATQSVLKLF
ncbi:MAG: hypothetical protein J5787_02575 [Alphaproteobacteria bacterium]|nr:hypothetical protein [Alphaproteobacteria bacterium]